MKLSGKTALITGGTRGIGLACARALAEAGANIAVVGQDEQRVREVTGALSAAGTRAQGICGDVSDEALAVRAFAEAEEKLGPVAVLVNNAGIVEIAKVVDMSAEAFDRVLDVNLRGAFLFAREAARRMAPRGEGRIITLSSISATMGTPKLSAYCASKWGSEGFIKALAAELAGTGVLSMGVSPGSVDTDMLRKSGFPPAMTPEDVAVVVRFLATEAPRAMQGSIVEMFG